MDLKNRIFGLDFLRALAILLVFISHSTLLLFPNQTNFLLNVIRFFGTVGVDVFFVLSGYLIGRILLKQIETGKTSRKDILYFLLRRWFRTLPNYYFILILNVLIVFFFYREIITGVSDFFVFLQNFKEPIPDFFTESWSLSIEEFAYIIAPILFLTFKALSNDFLKSKLFLFTILVIICLVFLFRVFAYFNLSFNSYNDWTRQIRKVVIYRIDSVYYGFFGAYISLKTPRLWCKYKREAFFLGMFVFLVTHACIFSLNLQPETFPLFYTVFYLPLLSISILLFFPVFSTWKEKTFFKRQITYISILSYALYLINYSLVLLTIRWYINIEELTIMPKGLILLVYWILSFYLSHILYKYFEKPLTNLRDSKFIRNKFRR